MQSVILVAFTAFSAPDAAAGARAVPALRFEGQLDEIVLEADLVHQDHKYVARPPVRGLLLGAEI